MQKKAYRVYKAFKPFRKHILIQLIFFKKHKYKNIYKDSPFFTLNLYYYLNMPITSRHSLDVKDKFINFIKRLVPRQKLYNKFSAEFVYRNLNNILYKNTFINNCIDILTLEEIETFYIYDKKPHMYYSFLKINFLNI